MPNNRIKGITIEIGGDTTKLDKALGGVERNLSTIQQNLRAVEQKLKFDPGNVELLAQKQRLYADELSQAASKADVLKAAMQDLNRQLGEGTISAAQYEKQFSNVKLELDLTNAEIGGVERALAELNDQLDKVDGPAGNAADGISAVGNAAGSAKGGLGGMGSSAGGASISLGGLEGVAAGAALAIGTKLVDAVVEVVKWMWSLDEATKEYREGMGKLNTAFETAGFSTETAKEAYQGFYNILGDTDTAVEASQLLAQLVDDEKDVARWTETAAGVYGTFGDALPIEGLIEAANETAKTGKVTGVLADALNWVGISEDDFNKTLEKNIDVGNRADLIMETLARTYGDAADAFYENNEALIASREAQSELDESLAEIGEAVSNVKTALSEAFGPTLGVLAKAGATALNALVQPIKAIGDALDWLGERVRDVANFFRDLFGVSGQLDENWNVVQTGGRSSPAIAEAYSVSSPYALASFSARDLPHLAQGAVTRTNSPFLAVVGDNPQEPEVIAPYSTIKQAALEAVTEYGKSSGATRVTVNFTGTLAQLVRLMQPQITVETGRRGPDLVT